MPPLCRLLVRWCLTGPGPFLRGLRVGACGGPGSERSAVVWVANSSSVGSAGQEVPPHTIPLPFLSMWLSTRISHEYVYNHLGAAGVIVETDNLIHSLGIGWSF